jgi:hypothetical protein
VLIPFELGAPILQPRLRNMGINAFTVLMPKTATNFDDLLPGCENEIWLSGEVRHMQSIAVAHAVN